MHYTKLKDKIKSLISRPATAEAIKTHTQRVQQGLVFCGLPICPKCELSPDFFKLHDKRKRTFYVVENQIIIILIGLLPRWKCPGCKKTTTDYPDFALPYKRYTLPTILAFCGSYVDDPQSSYRGLVNAFSLEHKTKSDLEPGQSAMMQHTTIHRWITTLGRYSNIVNNATDLILQKQPGSSLCRDLATLKIPAKKYRSLLRKQLLLGCFSLVILETAFSSVFQVSIFPQLATNCGYR